ncbi:MAG TPA: hypothetical protein VHR45_00320 [Thermoanaerobaculia bacterium]|nr:hypothetical protein [Thermoanaerobaculia bacterium]
MSPADEAGTPAELDAVVGAGWPPSWPAAGAAARLASGCDAGLPQPETSPSARIAGSAAGRSMLTCP